MQIMASRLRVERLVRSVPTEHECLEWKHERLKSQNQGVHERKGIHNVKSCAFEEASLF